MPLTGSGLHLDSSALMNDGAKVPEFSDPFLEACRVCLIDPTVVADSAGNEVEGELLD
jgi:hypothetical protein